MNPIEKEIVRQSVESQLGIIREQRQKFSVEELIKQAETLCQNLLDRGSKPQDAFQFTEDAIRYLKQHLADIGMHSPAFELSTLQNKYRAKCHKELGQKSKFLLRKLNYLLHGYLNSYWRVIVLAIIICVISCVVLWGFWLITGYPSLVYSNQNQTPVPWYYYPYFSIVTFATLGYGDMAPNTHDPWGWVPAYVACFESVSGIVVLGLFIYVLVSRLGAHPVIRASRWFNDYERKILQRKVSFYDEDFKYDQ